MKVVQVEMTLCSALIVFFFSPRIKGPPIGRLQRGARDLAPAAAVGWAGPRSRNKSNAKNDSKKYIPTRIRPRALTLPQSEASHCNS